MLLRFLRWLAQQHSGGAVPATGHASPDRGGEEEEEEEEGQQSPAERSAQPRRLLKRRRSGSRSRHRARPVAATTSCATAATCVRDAPAGRKCAPPFRRTIITTRSVNINIRCIPSALRASDPSAGSPNRACRSTGKPRKIRSSAHQLLRWTRCVSGVPPTRGCRRRQHTSWCLRRRCHGGPSIPRRALHAATPLCHNDFLFLFGLIIFLFLLWLFGVVWCGGGLRCSAGAMGCRAVLDACVSVFPALCSVVLPSRLAHCQCGDRGRSPTRRSLSSSSPPLLRCSSLGEGEHVFRSCEPRRFCIERGLIGVILFL
jgi:hypothetical protein